MSTIQLKRGNNTGLAQLTLQAGEPAFVLDTGKLYIGNGTDKVLVNPDNSKTATKLEVARDINLTGDVTGTASFDGSTNANITTSLSDTGVGAGTYTKVTVDTKGRVTQATNLVEADIPELPMSKITGLGTAASKNTGTASGNIPVLDNQGKLDISVVPAIAITDTFLAASETEMLALDVQVGDICVRTDLHKSFILKKAGANLVENWQELLTPESSVQSVAGKTGVVTLVAGDVGLENVTNESKETMFTNPAFTGVPVAPTAEKTANSTQIATTAFVKSQGYLDSASVIDGGTF